MILFNIAEKYDPKTNYRIKQLLSKANSVNALAVGNSHACALDFNALGIDGYRVALGGNDISEAVYQVKSLVPLLPNLKTIFFNISYFSLYTDNSSYPDYYSIFNKMEYDKFIKRFPFASAVLDTFMYSGLVFINTNELSTLQKNKLGAALDIIMENTSDRLKIRWDYYNSIPSINYIEGDFLNYFLSRISIIIRSDHWHGVINNILSFQNVKKKSPFKVISWMDNYGQPVDSLRNSFKSDDSLNTLAKYYIVPTYLCDRQMVLSNNPDVLNKNINKLISVIKYLKSQDKTIIFYTSPVHKYFTYYFDKSVIKMMREKMSMLKREYGIKYFDFSDDTLLTVNNTYFYNSDHLNRLGAEKFSKIFRESLDSSKVLLSIN